jgi:hypothetical protein
MHFHGIRTHIYLSKYSGWRKCAFNIFYIVQHSLVGQDLFIIEVQDHPHLDAPHSVGLLWASDQSKEDTSTWLNTTLTRERRPFPRLESNPQSQ